MSLQCELGKETQLGRCEVPCDKDTVSRFFPVIKKCIIVVCTNSEWFPCLKRETSGPVLNPPYDDLLSTKLPTYVIQIKVQIKRKPVRVKVGLFLTLCLYFTRSFKRPSKYKSQLKVVTLAAFRPPNLHLFATSSRCKKQKEVYMSCLEFCFHTTTLSLTWMQCYRNLCRVTWNSIFRV